MAALEVLAHHVGERLSIPTGELDALENGFNPGDLARSISVAPVDDLALP
jgi:hypothetical protein